MRTLKCLLGKPRGEGIKMHRYRIKIPVVELAHELLHTLLQCCLA